MNFTSVESGTSFQVDVNSNSGQPTDLSDGGRQWMVRRYLIDSTSF